MTNESAKPERLTVTASFELGERLEIEISKYKSTAGKDHPPKVESSQAYAEILVLGRREKDTELSWRPFARANEAVTEAEAAAANSMMGEVPPMRMLVNGSGEIVGVVNWKDVQEASGALTAKILRERGTTEETIRKSLGALRAACPDEGSTKAMLLKDAAPYFIACGKTVATNKPLVEEIDIGMGLMHREYRLKPLQKGRAAREITYTDTFPPAVLTAILERMFGNEPNAAGVIAEIKKSADVGAARIVDEGKIEYVPGTSTVRMAKLERTVEIADLKIVERTEYRLALRERVPPLPEIKNEPSRQSTPER